MTAKGVEHSLDNLACNLELLNLYGNSKSVTSASLGSLAKCKNLQHLNLGYCNSAEKEKLPLRDTLLASGCHLISLELSR